jgi:glycerophosphoryl diester phosphodiesterase
MYRAARKVCLLLGLVSVSAAVGAAPQGPIVVAHRGASGYLPEHTLEAYAMAYALGADYIEPDLVRTRDGAFICLHDVHLDSTTDVETAFPDRVREDGRWYAADLTLAEVRSLRVHERLEQRFPQGAARFHVPTFEEMIELVQGLNHTTGRTVGIYPELKAPAFHREQGLAMEQPFLALLGRYGYEGAQAAIFVQCFEQEPLVRMREMGSQLPQVFLVGDDDADRLTAAGLREIAGFADGIGPAKTILAERPEIVSWAHQAGLAVHPYTFRADDLGDGFAALEDELEAYYGTMGVDGVFTDFPDRARSWLDSWLAAGAGASE